MMRAPARGPPWGFAADTQLTWRLLGLLVNSVRMRLGAIRHAAEQAGRAGIDLYEPSPPFKAANQAYPQARLSTVHQATACIGCTRLSVNPQACSPEALQALFCLCTSQRADHCVRCRSTTTSQVRSPQPLARPDGFHEASMLPGSAAQARCLSCACVSMLTQASQLDISCIDGALHLLSLQNLLQSLRGQQLFMAAANCGAIALYSAGALRCAGTSGLGYLMSQALFTSLLPSPALSGVPVVRAAVQPALQRSAAACRVPSMSAGGSGLSLTPCICCCCCCS